MFYKIDFRTALEFDDDLSSMCITLGLIHHMDVVNPVPYTITSLEDKQKEPIEKLVEALKRPKELIEFELRLLEQQKIEQERENHKKCPEYIDQIFDYLKEFERENSNFIIANDPDADRMAIADRKSVV